MSDEVSADLAAGETLYLAIYERVATKSDYMQPDDYRQMLPETAIVAGVAAVIAGILKGISDGFLSEVGGTLAAKAGRLLQRLKPEDPEAKQLATVLAETVPMLRVHQANWDEITALIALELTRRGMGFHISQEVAQDIVTSLRRELRGVP